MCKYILTLLDEEFLHGVDCLLAPVDLFLRESDFVDDLFQCLRDGVDVRRRRIRHVADEEVLSLGSLYSDVTILVDVAEAQLSRVQVIVAGAAEELSLGGERKGGGL